jgi:hypothetical protein
METVRVKSSSRTVVLVGPVVVKVAGARDSHNGKDNGPGGSGWCARHIRKEIALWERVRGTDDERHFAALLAHDPRGKWLVQVRVVENNRRRTSAHYEKVEELGLRYGLDDLDYTNWTVGRGGQVVIFDYGL